MKNRSLLSTPSSSGADSLQIHPCTPEGWRSDCKSCSDTDNSPGRTHHTPPSLPKYPLTRSQGDTTNLPQSENTEEKKPTVNKIYLRDSGELNPGAAELPGACGRFWNPLPCMEVPPFPFPSPSFSLPFPFLSHTHLPEAQQSCNTGNVVTSFTNF